ncbi:hypothetical protein [Vibrio phage vB_VmeM-Yong XC32]|nr:hypothetical protein [Vibrio phage vB_VmeM-Yong XC31]QAX96563.1 hypothetical protein [Vibrio phage vB_VmeM-Yong XC32]QAX96881.1 hypothetical protein [Vibrio phage vB_VmeM-Yong MS31]QAX97186.1 hypothetical protein [Vibrio phage vB_VmeM-Yong MS32]
MLRTNPIMDASLKEVTAMNKIRETLAGAQETFEKREVIVIGVGTWNKAVADEIYTFIATALGLYEKDKRILIATSYDKSPFKVFAKGKEGDMTDVEQLVHSKDSYEKTVELEYVRQIEELRKSYAKTIVIMDLLYTDDDKPSGKPISEVYKYATTNRFSAIYNLPKLD